MSMFILLYDCKSLNDKYRYASSITCSRKLCLTNERAGNVYLVIVFLFVVVCHLTGPRHAGVLVLVGGRGEGLVAVETLERGGFHVGVLLHVQSQRRHATELSAAELARRAHGVLLQHVCLVPTQQRHN